MNNQTPDKSRRAVLKGLIGIPVVAIAGYQSVSYAAMLSMDDPTAKALSYTEKSTVDGKTCSNCGIYQGGSAASGGCPIFAGKDVAATGYCKSWVAKA
ncbi:MAG: high-potential iron-sulfur protein [Gammaproteobacteria bacterium]|nr:high-potential iron-sulfur protein [Gammaproteobacteria bacterium]MBL6998447.1 high-potential iron-sulfur protein [Gammaproteobacteria bacterium]